MKGLSFNRLPRTLCLNLTNQGALLYAFSRLWPKRGTHMPIPQLEKRSQKAKETGPPHNPTSLPSGSISCECTYRHLKRVSGRFGRKESDPSHSCSGVPQVWKTYIYTLPQHELLQFCSHLQATHFPRQHYSISMTWPVTLQIIKIISFLILLAVALFFAVFPKFLNNRCQAVLHISLS